MASGVKAHCTVQSSSGLTDSEIEKMVKDAERNAEKDRVFRERAEIKNEGQQVLDIAQKALSQLSEGDGLTAEKKQETQKAIDAFQTALNGENVEDMKTSLQTLKAAQNHVSTLLYKKQASKGNANNNKQ